MTGLVFERAGSTFSGLAILASSVLAIGCDGGGDAEADTSVDTAIDDAADGMGDSAGDPDTVSDPDADLSSDADADPDPDPDTGTDGDSDADADAVEDSATPIVRLTVTSIGMSAFDFIAEDPSGSGVIGSGSQNQTLALSAGSRYEITNLASASHPFELLDMGATAGSDVVLLSESAAGSLESDPDVAWTDDSSGTIAFTLDPDLAAVISGYRCSIHVTTMRGAISL